MTPSSVITASSSTSWAAAAMLFELLKRIGETDESRRMPDRCASVGKRMRDRSSRRPFRGAHRGIETHERQEHDIEPACTDHREPSGSCDAEAVGALSAVSSQRTASCVPGVPIDARQVDAAAMRARKLDQWCGSSSSGRAAYTAMRHPVEGAGHAARCGRRAAHSQIVQPQGPPRRFARRPARNLLRSAVRMGLVIRRHGLFRIYRRKAPPHGRGRGPARSPWKVARSA